MVSLLRYLYNPLRLFLGIIFFTSGVGKLIPGFPSLIGPVWLVERLTEHGLGLFAQFVAVSQLTVGYLLLTRRFAILGAVMLVPMLLCTLVITISLQWAGTPYILAGLLAMNIVLLVHDFHRLKFIINEDDQSLRQLPIVRPNQWIDLYYAVGLLLIIGLISSYPVLSAQYIKRLIFVVLLINIAFALWQWRKRSKRKFVTPPQSVSSQTGY